MTIIAAAVKYGYLICHIPAPGRHPNVLHAVYGVRDSLTPRGEIEFERKIQGFLDDKGNFLTRKEAYIHATECNQPWFRSTDPKQYQGDELYSEDVWESGDKFISPFTKIKKCCVFGTSNNLHVDYWHGYRCSSYGCNVV